MKHRIIHSTVLLTTLLAGPSLMAAPLGGGHQPDARTFRTNGSTPPQIEVTAQSRPPVVSPITAPQQPGQPAAPDCSKLEEEVQALQVRLATLSTALDSEQEQAVVRTRRVSELEAEKANLEAQLQEALRRGEEASVDRSEAEEILRRELAEARSMIVALQAELEQAGDGHDPGEPRSFDEAYEALSFEGRAAFDHLATPGSWKPVIGEQNGFPFYAKNSRYGTGIAQPHSLAALVGTGALVDSRTGKIRMYALLATEHTDHGEPWSAGALPMTQSSGGVGWDETMVNQSIDKNEHAQKVLEAVSEIQAFLREWGEEAVKQELLMP